MQSDRQLLAKGGRSWGWMGERSKCINLEVLGLVANGWSGTSAIKGCQNYNSFLSSVPTPQFLIGLFCFEGTVQMTQPLEYMCVSAVCFLEEAGPAEW